VGHSFKTYFRLTIRDKNGKVVKRTHQKISRSYLIQFLGLIELQFRGTDNPIGKDITGAARTGDVSECGDLPNLKMNALDDDGSYGIVVGTGTAAESDVGYALQTIIAHGVGATQLDYGAHSFVAASVVGANVDMIANRTFVNSSGGSITVEEIAIYVKAEYTTSTAAFFCILRDLTGGVAVANGQTLTVEFTFRTTV